MSDEAIAELIQKALETTPPDVTHWSVRTMARVARVAPSTVHKVWRAFGLGKGGRLSMMHGSGSFIVRPTRVWLSTG